MDAETTKAAHTPGPWTAPIFDGGLWDSETTTDVEAKNAPFEIIATVSEAHDYQTWKANARLIAAAPDLLAAAKLMVLAYQDSTCIIPACDCEMCQLVAAIAKAEGS